MNNQTNAPAAQNDDEIDLLELLSTLLENKWFILGTALLTTLLAFVYAFGQLPTYKSDALLQVEKQSSGVPGLSDLAGLGGDDASVGTELEIIQSRKVLGQAIEKLKLDIYSQPRKVPLLSTAYKHLFNNDTINKPPLVGSILNQYAWGKDNLKMGRLEVPDSLINKPLVITKTAGNTFTLQYDDKVLLSGEIGHYVKGTDSNIEINILLLEAQTGTQFIVAKLSKLEAIKNLKQNLQVSEKGKKTGIMILSLTGKNKQKIKSTLDLISNIYLQQNKSRSKEEASNALKFLKEQIKPIREKSKAAEAKLQGYRTRNRTADMSMETRAILEVIASIDTEIQKLSLEKEELKLQYTPNHPKFQAMKSQVLQLEKRKKRTLSEISALPETQQDLLALENDYKVANSIYIDLLNNIQEFKIAKASSIGNVYILDTAEVYDKPVKPKKSMILALGSLLGLMLGTLIVFIRKALHQGVNNPEKLEEVTSIPVYATVPFTKAVSLTGRSKDKKQKTLLAIDQPEDPAIESLRSLRTSLHFALLEAKNNIVMITGPAPGIGKSFISSNFAAVTASSEQRVLLIDADMRKGYLHNLMNQNITPGLSDLISDTATLDEAIHTIQVGENSLDIITRGKTPPNPSELLMHSNFEKLLSKLSSMYDLILIDTPPVHAVTDPTIIGKLSGVTFMVVRSDQHSMKEIEHAITRLAHTGIETKGFIFNAYEPKKNGGYGYHSYYGDYKSD